MSKIVPPPKRIAQPFLLDQVHVPAEQAHQFIPHFPQVEEVPFGVRLETHQHVHVAFRAEILAQDGPEQGELPDLPTPTEPLDSVPRNIDVPADHNLNIAEKHRYVKENEKPTP